MTSLSELQSSPSASYDCCCNTHAPDSSSSSSSSSSDRGTLTSLLLSLPVAVAAVILSHLEMEDHAAVARSGTHLHRVAQMPSASPQALTYPELGALSVDSTLAATRGMDVQQRAAYRAKYRGTSAGVLIARFRPRRLAWQTNDVAWLTVPAFADSLRRLTLDVSAYLPWRALSALRNLEAFHKTGDVDAADLWRTVCRLARLVEIRIDSNVTAAAMSEFARAPALTRLVFGGASSATRGEATTVERLGQQLPVLPHITSLAFKDTQRLDGNSPIALDRMLQRLPGLRSASGLAIVCVVARRLHTSFAPGANCPLLARVDTSAGPGGLRYMLTQFPALHRLTLRTGSSLIGALEGSEAVSALPGALQRVDLLGFRGGPVRPHERAFVELVARLCDARSGDRAITHLAFRRCGLYGSPAWNLPAHVDLDRCALDAEALAGLGGTCRVDRVAHLRIAHCVEVWQRQAAAGKRDPQALALPSLPTTTTATPPHSAGEWRLDVLEVAPGYRYVRPIAVLALTRRFANVTRLEYAGAAIGRAEFALSDRSRPPPPVTAGSDREQTWIQSDICDAIRALPRLVYLSLEGMTNLSGASRRTIRVLVASLTPALILVE